MATISFPVPHFGRTERAAKPATTGSFWSRAFDRLIEARMAQAKRELDRYSHVGSYNSDVLGAEWKRSAK